ncbi:MAG: SDR family oxidoreductase [Pseudomonadota bacterium]
MSQKVFIIGATSAIAESYAQLCAAQQAELCLLGRNQDKLKAIADDLTIRGAHKVSVITADINTLVSHAEHIQTALSELGGLDVVLIAHGTLPDQAQCQQDVTQCLSEINTNGVSTVSLLSQVSEVMASQNSGSLVVISSVAGDRGRQSNYVYGSAKAMVSAFAEGLISRFDGSGVHVALIKPGFVDTPMTQAFDKGALWAQSEDIARAIKTAIEKKRSIVYAPFFWWGIMQIIKNIPTFVFKKLSL